MTRLTLSGVLDVYFSWKGRIGRAEFWAFGVALNMIWFIGTIGLAGTPGPVGMVLVLAWYALFLFGSAGLMVKRGHDRGRPAAFLLAILGLRSVAWFFAIDPDGPRWPSVIVVALLLYVLVDYAILPGQKRENRYGPSPSGYGAHKNPLVLGGEEAALPTEPPKA